MRTALVATLLLLLPAAGAFTSVPLGSSNHDDVTAVAADAGWSEDAVRALQQAVREPDFRDGEVDPEGTDLARVDASGSYRPEHHCDRVPPATDAEAFNATVGYVQAQRAEALAHAQAGDPDAALAALGNALHALQDCFSHSDLVDQPTEVQRAAEDALLHGGAPPAALRLTGFAPGADDPESPPDDPYPHRDFAKDEAGKNDESRRVLEGTTTAFDAAMSLARQATVAFLQEFGRDLAPHERAALLDVPEEDRGLPDRLNVAGPAWLALAIAAIAVAGLRRP